MLRRTFAEAIQTAIAELVTNAGIRSRTLTVDLISY